MTATHDDQEIEITDPDDLLQVFEQQRIGALHQVDQAREGIEQVKNTLNQLFKVPGQDEAAVDRAWKQLKPVRQVLKQMDAVLTGAYNIIETAIEQRDELAVEVADINEAINNEDTDHPTLKPLADTIHRNAFDQGYESGYGAGSEADMDGEFDDLPDEEYIESAVSDAASQWNIPRRMADDVIAAIRGEIQVTNAQREAFRAFLATF